MGDKEKAVLGGGEIQPEDVSAIIAAAHELKSPLVLIRQLALAVADESSESERQLLVDQLTRVAERGLRLTTDLTRTARLDDALFETEPVNAQQLCESIVQQVAPLYQHHGRSIRIVARRARPIVLAHRELLTSIIYHFADNALHYGDASSEVSVVLTKKIAAKTLRIGVRDRGPAMSLKEWRLARSQAQAHLANRPQASGIGLYITEQFSQAMGGQTGLIRHRDGATFYVDLPISEQLSLL